MKRISLLISAFVISISAANAQALIPNGGFESFGTSGAKDPTDWNSIDAILSRIPTVNINSCEQDTNAAHVYAGLSSVKLTTSQVSIPTIGGISIAGSMSLGAYGVTLALPPVVTLGGVAYTDRPDSLVFAYQYETPVGATDSGLVTVNLTKHTAADGTITVGTASFYTYYSNSFTIAKAKIIYSSAQNPDTLKMQAQSSATLIQGGVPDTKLWLDDMHFVGLDTAFKAYVNPKGFQTTCQGDSFTLKSDNISGDTYQWYKNNAIINGATSYKYKASAFGRYYVVVNHLNQSYNSDTVNLLVLPLPIVSISGNVDSICNNHGNLQLVGGLPTGGNYSVNGRPTNNGIYNLNGVTAGDKTITYTYTSPIGCKNSATEPIHLWGCTTGIELLQPDTKVNIYPNPVTDYMTIDIDPKLIGGTITVTDMQGKVVLTKSLEQSLTNISITALSAGNYQVEVTNSNHKPVAIAKIVVNK